MVSNRNDFPLLRLDSKAQPHLKPAATIVREVRNTNTGKDELAEGVVTGYAPPETSEYEDENGISAPLWRVDYGHGSSISGEVRGITFSILYLVALYKYLPFLFCPDLLV